MMISVCMATYNGERFIEEQLKCIYQQTLRPDEVIICDDDSTDATRSKVENFIQKHKLEKNWRLVYNEVKKGYPNNFYYCMSLARGDIVFLADQDDVWDLRKIEKMSSAMRSSPQIEVLACKMALIDTKGNEIRTVIKPNFSHETGKIKLISLEQVLYKNQWSGMVLAYRNAWYQGKRASIQDTKLPHDLALAILAGAEGGMFQMDSVLAKHRRHESNAAGEEHKIARLLRKGNKIQDINKYARYMEIALEQNILKDETQRRILESKYGQMATRGKLLEEGKCLPIIKNYIKNRRQIRAYAFICDFLICLFGK